jgi:hypothetical protein
MHLPRDIFLLHRDFIQQHSTAADPDPARNCPSAVDPRAVRQESPGTTVGLLQLKNPDGDVWCR